MFKCRIKLLLEHFFLRKKNIYIYLVKFTNGTFELVIENVFVNCIKCDYLLVSDCVIPITLFVRDILNAFSVRHQGQAQYQTCAIQQSFF